MCGIVSTDILRPVWEWINSFDQFPQNAGPVETEFLGRGPAFSLSVENAPVVVSQFISGSFLAQLQFSVRFRTSPASSPQRLDALEILDRLAVWMQNSLPVLDSPLHALAIEKNAPAVLESRNQDGSEIFRVRFTLTYQVSCDAIP